MTRITGVRTECNEVRNTYLVIETTNMMGKVALLKTVSPSENITAITGVITISAYARKKDAQKQVDFLNELYKKRKQTRIVKIQHDDEVELQTFYGNEMIWNDFSDELTQESLQSVIECTMHELDERVNADEADEFNRLDNLSDEEIDRMYYELLDKGATQ